MSERHQEALAHLLFGVKDQDGFVQLTGEVGTGKTTLIRALMAQLPDGIDLALIFNPKLSVFEFVASICDELHIKYPAETDSVKVLVDALNIYLLDAYSQGRRVILVVDEAQNLHFDVLEQIRLLTNLETAKHKLLQIVLVGQPELREVLAQVNLRQLSQRITARYHLAPMTLRETKGYVIHRLKVAGAKRNLFTRGAIDQIQRLSGGVPRLINVLCDRALLGAYVREEPQVSESIVKKSATEVYGKLNIHRKGTKQTLWIAMVAASVLIFLGVFWKFGSAWLPSASSVAINQSDEVARLPSDPATLADTSASVVSIKSGDELKRVLQTSPESKSIGLALSGLFASWRMEYGKTVGATGCERAMSQRLLCYWGVGTWSEYLALNRPAIIWVNAGALGGKQYIVIKSLRDGRGVVEIAGTLYRVSEQVLRQMWSDRYLLFWRPPTLGDHLIKLGDRSEEVVWLRRNMERILGRNMINRDVDLYDKTLEGYVKILQRKHGLVDDGIVGIKTLIVINSLSGEEAIPILNHKGSESSE